MNSDRAIIGRVLGALLALTLSACSAHAQDDPFGQQGFFHLVADSGATATPTATPTVTNTPTVTPTATATATATATSAGGCSAEPAFVQAPAGFSGASGVVARTFASNTTAGSLIVVGIWIEGTSATISSVVDTQGNTYAEAVPRSGSWSSGKGTVWYAQNTAGGADVVTVTLSDLTKRVNAHVAEFSGVATSAALDVVGTSLSGGDNPCSDAATTTQDKDLIYSFVTNDGGDATPGGSLVSHSTYTFNKYTQAGSYKQTTAGSTTACWTTVSTNEGIAQMASFKCKP